MVETAIESPAVEVQCSQSDIFTVPMIFVEDRDDEVNGQIMNELNSDHYSPSVRNVYVSKPIEATSGFGFHLSRSKWDPYPYVSRVDKDSFASSSGLKEGDCVLEVNNSAIIRSMNEMKQIQTEDRSEGRTNVCDRKCLQFFIQV